MSDKVNELTVHAERFFTRLIMKVDDYGCFHADTRLLKANLYPLLLDTIREADLLRWMAECQKAGLIVLYENEGKKYVQILDFRQRLDKAKSKYPLPTDNDLRESVNDFPAEVETEVEPEKNRANALVAGNPAPQLTEQKLRGQYGKLADVIASLDRKEAWAQLKDFIQEHRPRFIEPYVSLWNLFVTGPHFSLPEVRGISDSRKKKFKVRIGDSEFDFVKILSGISASAYLRGNNAQNWAVSFDWIIENDKNYLKILEGNYN